MSFQAANLRSARVPLIKELPVAQSEIAQAFQRGALLVETNGEWAEVAVNDYDKYQGPIDGTALARYGIDGTLPYLGSPSFDMIGGFGFPPGMMQAVVVILGDREKLWSAEFVGTLPANPGGSYGVIRVGGEWKVDFDDTATPVVRLESLVWSDPPLNKNRVVVSFLAGEEY